MQEKVEKYIYFVSENRYRIKFLKVSKKDNIKISFDQYINGTLDEAIKIRDAKLKENGLLLNKQKKDEDFFEIKKNTKNTQKIKSKKECIKKSSKATNKVDKYIYEIEKGKKYRIFIRKGGSNGQKGDYYSTVFEGTLAQAKKERDKKLAEFKLKNGKGNKSNIKFIDFVRIYYKEYAEIELSPTTVQTGKSELKNYILPEIANMPLYKIDGLIVQRIINKLKKRKRERPDKNGNIVTLSSTTVNSVYRLLRKILNKAVAWNYIESNPVLTVNAPSVSTKEKESYNIHELIEVMLLLEKEDITTELLFNLFICTGMRRGELVGLHLDNIHLDKNFIKIEISAVWDSENKKIVEKKTKSEGGVREIPIPQFCVDKIKEYLKLRERKIMNFKRKNKNYVAPKNLFLSRSGGIMFPDTPSNKWTTFKNKHKQLKDVTLHGLRHSYCSMQMNDNPNLAPSDVKTLMGHSQLSTTFIYTHSNEDKREAALSIFDKHFRFNNEKKVSFNEILSLYTGKKFISTDIFNSYIDFLVSGEESIEIKLNLIRKYIEKKYPFFRSIDITVVNLDNIWDWLDKMKEKYGNEFILCPIK